MKKLLALALTLVLMLALSACGETKGSGEPVAGGAVSDMPNTDRSTTETEQSQPADIELESWTVACVGTEKTFELTAEETAAISDIPNESNWIEDLAKCESDCVITTADGDVLYYHSACGTFNDNKNYRSLSTTEEEMALINSILNQYSELEIDD